MADKELGGLTAATTPLDGTELHYVVQGDNSRKVAGSEIVKISHTQAWSTITSTPTTLSGYGITDAASSSQGSLADTAVQPDDLADVATSGDYDDLANLPTLGTAAATDADDYATAAQGTKADSALQSADIGDSVQAYDALLTSIAGLTTTSGDIVYATASDTAAALNIGTEGQVLKVSAAGQPEWGAAAGGGDMLISTYDPDSVGGDAFDMANMVEAADAKVLTADERIAIAGALQSSNNLSDVADVPTALDNLGINVDGTVQSAEAAADRAEQAAASIDLPDIEASAFLRAKGDASGYETLTADAMVDALAEDASLASINVIRGGHIRTPYDYGVSKLDPATADVSTALQAMIDDMRSDFQNSLKSFQSQVNLAHRPWLTGTSLDISGVRQSGMIFADGAIYGSCTSRPILDLSGTQGVQMSNLRVWGDSTDIPSVGILLQRAAPYGGAGVHQFANISVDGFFKAAAIINYGSEVNSFVNAQISNRIKTGNRPALIIASDDQYITKWCGAVVSNYAAAGSNKPTGGQSTLNNNLGVMDIRRSSAIGRLAIASISKTSPAVITLVSPPPNTTSLQKPETGDVVWFASLDGMEELYGSRYGLKKLTDTTYELYNDGALTDPVDASGFSNFNSGQLATATGPAIVIAGGASDIAGASGYVLSYGSDAVVFDSEYSAASMDRVHLAFHHENKPFRSIRYITPVSGTAIHRNQKIEILNKNQSQSASVIGVAQSGAGAIELHDFDLRAEVFPDEPSSGFVQGGTPLKVVRGNIVLGKASVWHGTAQFGGGFSGRVVTLDDDAEHYYGILDFDEDGIRVGEYSASGASTGKRMRAANLHSSNESSNTVSHQQFANPNGIVGQITTSGSSTSYTTSSDERLKDFIGAYNPIKAVEIIKADPVREFTWKTDGSHAIGWGAQTSFGISDDLATYDETTDSWGVDQGKRTPYLWAAVSSLVDDVEALKISIAELRKKNQP